MFPETHPSVPTQNNICSTDSIGAGSIQSTSTVEKMQYGIMGPTEPGALTFPRQVWRCLPRVECHLSPRKKADIFLSLDQSLATTGDQAPTGALYPSCGAQGFTSTLATPAHILTQLFPIPRHCFGLSNTTWSRQRINRRLSGCLSGHPSHVKCFHESGMAHIVASSSSTEVRCDAFGYVCEKTLTAIRDHRDQGQAHSHHQSFCDNGQDAIYQNKTTPISPASCI